MSLDEDICYLNSPVGWLEITADADGLRSIEFLKQQPLSTPAVDNPHLKRAYKQLGEYFSGERARFDLTLNLSGSDFQRAVWQKLSDIPFGSTVSYGDIATAVGNPKASRAVGMANNRNPLPIVIPCHRVIGRDGQMVGYGSGLDIKRKLLEHEGISEK